MREIRLYLERVEYNAGDTISGTAEIVCDKEFSYNEMYVELKGREHTWVTRHVGKHSYTYTEEYFHVNEKFELMPSGSIQSGEIRVPFSFTLPEDVPTSYKGTRGFIEYTLEGKIEVSWARDPKHKIGLMISGTSTPISPSTETKSELEDGVPQIDAVVENNEIYPGDILKVRYRIERQDKMRGVRIDVETTENVTADGYGAETSKKYSEVFIDEDQIPRGSWREIGIQTPQDLPVTYDGPLVKLENNLKVVIDIPWGLDKDVVFPLIVRNKQSETNDLFGDSATDHFEF
ncbi:MAG: hypothetical protein ACFFF4_07115 [Candidatus Thorarchaeota archaeon]